MISGKIIYFSFQDVTIFLEGERERERDRKNDEKERQRER